MEMRPGPGFESTILRLRGQHHYHSTNFGSHCTNIDLHDYEKHEKIIQNDSAIINWGKITVNCQHCEIAVEHSI